jgi:hypothetical protein
LLLIKDGQILLERYQYDRKPMNRFISQSMAKSIVSIAIGMATTENRIASLDDPVSKYVPGLAGSPYGDTSIRGADGSSAECRWRQGIFGRRAHPIVAGNYRHVWTLVHRNAG